MQMSGWYSLNLGDALLAESALNRIKTLFTATEAPITQHGNMAIFIRHESEGQLHCAIKLYFSPAVSSLARTLGATPCTKPAKTDLGLFAGIEQAWERCFGDG